MENSVKHSLSRRICPGAENAGSVASSITHYNLNKEKAININMDTGNGRYDTVALDIRAETDVYKQIGSKMLRWIVGTFLS